MGNGSAFNDHFKLGNHREGGRRRKLLWQERVKFAFRVLGDRARGSNVSWIDDERRSCVFRSVGQSGRSAPGVSLQVAKWKSSLSDDDDDDDGGGVQGRSNCEERRARCHDSTNGWPLHGWNAWRLERVRCILCQCHEGRAPVALETKSLNVRASPSRCAPRATTLGSLTKDENVVFSY